MITGKIILLISPEPWSHIFVSKHHYAIHLVERGNTVYFLNPPSATSLAVSQSEYNGLFVIDYDGFVKGLRLFPLFIQRMIMKKKFELLQQLCKCTFDIVWSFDNSVFYDFQSFPNRILKISHIVDLNQDFETAKAARTADICFGTTHYIVKRLKQFNNNAHFINHGFNIVKEPELMKLIGEQKIKLMYAGNLDIVYLDWTLIDEIVKSNPTIDFLFAGNRESENNIFKQPNVYYLGVLPACQLPAYYSQVDALLICYKADKFIEQLANPHKMMEYLGSGKVIVATKTQEYEKLASDKLIVMSDKNEEFPIIFSEVVTNLELWNSLEKQERRRNYALENTYGKQIDKIEKLLGGKYK